MKTKKWLIHVINHALTHDAHSFAQLDPSAYLDAERRRAGFDTGQQVDRLSDALQETLGVSISEYHSVNLLVHACELAASLLKGCHRTVIGYEIMACIAATLGQFDLVNAALLHRGGEHKDEEGCQIDELAIKLGHLYLQASPQLSGRFSTHPIVLFREWLDYTRIGEFAILFDKLRDTDCPLPADSQMLAINADAENRLRRMVSSAAALASADGIIDPPEQKLIESLIKRAGLSDADAVIAVEELRHPQPPSKLVQPQASLPERAFLYRLLFLGAYINGEHHESERAYIQSLACEFGDDESMLLNCEEIALANFTDNFADLNLAPKDSVLATVHSVLFKRFGGALERHRDRLLAEVQETAELLELLKVSRERPLTPDEEKRVREQAIDLLKAIPALAIFISPGGTLLLPLVIKYLGIELRPSSFIDDVRLGESKGSVDE